MEKPIVVKLSTGKIKDLVEYTEDGIVKERNGLCKRVDADYLQQPFRDLVSYMCDPTEDEFNMAYSPSEIQLAQRIEALTAQEGVVISTTKSSGYQINHIPLETIVGDKYNDIVQVEEVKHQGQVIPVNSLDLIIEVAMGGGQYR